MNIKKPLLISFLAILIFAGFFTFSYVDGCGTYNIGGWAWSENIGWVSFSCENCDGDNNGYTDVACGGNNSSDLEIDYGIDMSASTGVISSGEIWSSNIGWISFDYGKTGTPPAAPDYSGSGYLAQVSTSTYELSGWARALAASSSGSGGWDGWIKFGWDTGSATGTVSLNDLTNEFEGYAWGGDDSTSTSVIGWLSFNDKDYDGLAGTVDYQATTTVNFPPTASNLSDSYTSPCIQSRIPALSWEANESGSYIYQVQIDLDGGSFASPKIDATSTFSGISGSWIPACNYCCLTEKDNILWNTTYDWRVRIKVDGEETWSSYANDTNGFTTSIHCYPYSYFLCSYNETSWYDCDGDVSDGKCAAVGECISALPHAPAVGQDLYIKDVSTCYNYDDTSFDAQDCSVDAYNATTCTPQSTTTSYQWSFENITSNSGSDFATSVITIGEGTEWKISATTTDAHSPDQSCGHEEEGGVGLPLPEWQEIAPY